MVEAVLFDIDDTLLDHERASTSALVELAGEAAGTEADRDALLARWAELEERSYSAYLAGEITLWESRRRRAAGFLEVLDQEHDGRPDLEDWYREYLRRYERNWVAFDDVHPALEALGSRVAGVITNAEPEPQRRKLERVGLSERLPLVVASGELGIAKPDPGIFLHACERLGIEPERVAYVGDRLETDALGAAEAGMRGIWLNRRTPPDAPVPPRVPVIASLAELPAIVG